MLDNFGGGRIDVLASRDKTVTAYIVESGTDCTRALREFTMFRSWALDHLPRYKINCLLINDDGVQRFYGTRPYRA